MFHKEHQHSAAPTTLDVPLTIVMTSSSYCQRASWFHSAQFLSLLLPLSQAPDGGFACWAAAAGHYQPIMAPISVYCLFTLKIFYTTVTVCNIMQFFSSPTLSSREPDWYFSKDFVYTVLTTFTIFLDRNSYWFAIFFFTSETSEKITQIIFFKLIYNFFYT